MDPNRLIEVPLLGNRPAVAIAFEIHIALVALLVGIAMVAPVAEALARRGDHRWGRLAHGLGTTGV